MHSFSPRLLALCILQTSSPCLSLPLLTLLHRTIALAPLLVNASVALTVRASCAALLAVSGRGWAGRARGSRADHRTHHRPDHSTHTPRRHSRRRKGCGSRKRRAGAAVAIVWGRGAGKGEGTHPGHDPWTAHRPAHNPRTITRERETKIRETEREGGAWTRR